jgi:hypothetical protein
VCVCGGGGVAEIALSADTCRQTGLATNHNLMLIFTPHVHCPMYVDTSGLAAARYGARLVCGCERARVYVCE